MEATELLSAVFGEDYPEHWNKSQNALSYLNELSSCGVEKLSHEPARLAEEKQHVLQQTRDLAFHNYKTFIETADCSREVFQDFEAVEDHLGRLLEKAPRFSQVCEEFSEAAQDLSARRRLNSITLARHTQLLEILEIPQLMDTCVRNTYYEEALELAAYVRQMSNKHSHIRLVADIVSDVGHCTQLMLQQLLQQLRGPVQLPLCLKIIGYLRRLEVFRESELRLKFLQARDAWFHGLVNAVSSEDPYQHISKIIDLCRVHLFDIITQYRAIFSDDDDPVLGSRAAASSSQACSSGLFHSWLVEKVGWFFRVLDADLQRGITGRLESLLGQCMYFGLSLGRIGADFRSLLPPLFQQAAMRNFMQSVEAAQGKFSVALSNYSLASSAVLHASSSLLASSFPSSGAGGVNIAPNQLLEFPPLAVLANGLVSALNDLRSCAPLALAPQIVHKMQTCLIQAAEELQAYYRTESGSASSTERASFTRLCLAFVEHLIPSLQHAFDALFPSELVLRCTGQPSSALLASKSSGILAKLQFDRETITRPLEEFLPKPILPSDIPIGDHAAAKVAVLADKDQATVPSPATNEPSPDDHSPEFDAEQEQRTTAGDSPSTSLESDIKKSTNENEAELEDETADST